MHKDLKINHLKALEINYSCCAAMGQVRAFLGNSEQQAEELEDI
ncbi:hypothetical protein P7M41_26195 [Vibrio parahaemolyticus]|nr:hypothetical protein [Vibrio parahaemolyticus]